MAVCLPGSTQDQPDACRLAAPPAWSSRGCSEAGTSTQALSPSQWGKGGLFPNSLSGAKTLSSHRPPGPQFCRHQLSICTSLCHSIFPPEGSQTHRHTRARTHAHTQLAPRHHRHNHEAPGVGTQETFPQDKGEPDGAGRARSWAGGKAASANRCGVSFWADRMRWDQTAVAGPDLVTGPTSQHVSRFVHFTTIKNPKPQGPGPHGDPRPAPTPCGMRWLPPRRHTPPSG